MNANHLHGRIYKFLSTYDIAGDRIESKVEVDNDRIFIKIGKEKKSNLSTLLKDKLKRKEIKIKENKGKQIPAIFLEDITGIHVTKKIRAANLIWIILAGIAMLVGAAGILLFILSLLFCVDRKITISQRNGKDIVIYSLNKENAYNFRDDMSTILNIR